MTASHFMSMQSFLEPWARKHGAGNDWKNDIVDDLAGRSRDRIQYTPASVNSHIRSINSINIIGDRFIVRAARDSRYEDTLFLVQIRPVGRRADINPTELRTLKAKWSLWSRAERGTAIDIPELFAERQLAVPAGVVRRIIVQKPGPTDELTHRVETILRGDEGEWLYPIPLDVDGDAPALLARLRRFYASYGGLVAEGPWSAVLTNEAQPSVIDERVRAAHEALALPLLEASMKRSAEEFRACLLALLTVPPPDRILRWLAESWLRGTPPERLAARVSVLKTVIDVSPGLTWARDSLAAVESQRSEHVPSNALSTTAQPAVPPAVRPAPVAELLVEARLRELRFHQALADAGIDVEMARAVRDHADSIPRRLELVKDAATALELVESVQTVAKIAAKMASALGPLASSHLDEDVTRALEDWRARAEWTDAGAWLPDLHSWSDARDLLAVVANDGVGSIPAWAWRSLAPSEVSIAESAYRALLPAETRADVRAAIDWLRTLSESERRYLAECPAADGETLTGRLQAAVVAAARADAARARCLEVATRVGSWAVKFLEHSLPLSLVELETSLKSLEEDLAQIAGRCEPRIVEELRAELQVVDDLKAAHDAVSAFLADVETLGDDVADYAGVQAIRKNAGRRRTSATPRTAAGTVAGLREVLDAPARLEIDHCLSDPTVRAAPLYLREQDNAIVTDIPFEIRVERTCDLDVEIDVSFAHLRRRRSLEERVRPVHLEMRKDDWEERAGRGWFGRTIVLEHVPIAPIRSDGKLLTAENASIDRIVARITVGTTTQELTFVHLLHAKDLPSTLFQPFTDTTERKEMKEHPLGLQNHFKALADDMRTGSNSLLVAAPRRFGKTTLLRSLSEELEDSKEIVVPRFVTSGVNPAGDARLEEHEIVRTAFISACKNLGEALDIPVDTDWRGDLPPASTFDRARQKAASMNRKAIYLLFDEAQALFRAAKGRQVAETLKARIETEWGVAKGGLVPIRFGLFGQLHLPRLIRGQLDALFSRPRITTEVSEEDLRRFLAARAKSVLSTASARGLLARHSQSFLVLRSLMQELEAALTRQKDRAWFVKADVEEATRSLVDSALALPDTPIQNYLRDPLNGSDDLTEWKPVTSYPVAVAWANVLGQRIESRPKRIEESVRLLGRWVEEFVPEGAGLTIAEERIRDALEELIDLGVLTREERFSSTMLERLLDGLSRSSRPLVASEEVRALQSLTIDEVAWRPGAELVAAGGEAKVYWVKSEKGELAIREADLTNEKKRSAFIQTCRVLRAIEGTRSRDVGYASLPVVREAGLRAGNPAAGLIVYDWINGTDLVKRIGGLADDIVVDIGWSLAEALVVLETRRIVHRDIKPENIVIDESGRPVLIDFGLARLRDYESHTLVTTGRDYLADEVVANPPQWSSKSDVFALAVLLRELRARGTSTKEAAALDVILGKANNRDVAARLGPREFAVELKSLAESLMVTERLQRTVTECRAVAEELVVPGVRDIGLKFAGYVAAVRTGHHLPFARVRFVSAFLDAAFAWWYVQTYPENRRGINYPYHLSKVSQGGHPELAVLDKDAVWVTGQLRHAESHKESVNALQAARKRARKALHGDDDATLIRAVQAAADALEQTIRCGGLSKVAKEWLRL